MVFKDEVLTEMKNRVTKIKEQNNKLSKQQIEKEQELENIDNVITEVNNEMAEMLKPEKTEQEDSNNSENVEKTESETEIDIQPEETSETFKCECIKCGHKMSSTKHCDTLKCSKCGGKMRREKRPGPGKAELENEIIDDSVITETAEEQEKIYKDYLEKKHTKNDKEISITVKNGLLQETADLTTKKELFEKEGRIPPFVNVKLAFAHVGTNLNLFTFLEEELIKAMPSVSGVAGRGIPIQWGHMTWDPRDTVGWTFEHEYLSGTAFATAKITNPEAIEMILRDELRFCSMGCYLTPICSICGNNMMDKKCTHIRGFEYKVNGKMVLCTVIGIDITFDHIGFTNFPADPLATVKPLAVAVASKEFDDIMKLKENNSIKKEEDVNMDDNEKILSEIKEKLDVLATKIDEVSVTEDEIVDVATKMSDLRVENEKLKEENKKLNKEIETLSEKTEKAEKELKEIENVNHEKVVNAILKAEKNINKDLDEEARKEELTSRSDEVLAALAEGLSHVKIEETQSEQKTIPNSQTPGNDSDKAFAEMTPAERREKFSFEEICEKLSHLNEGD